MPGGVNGLVLAQTIRERDPDLPVLVTTGYHEELVAQGPHPVAMDVVGKPYRRAELADRVRSALDRKGGPAFGRGPESSFGAAEG
jgi:DNA-binding response OmpR family regulator